MTPGEGSLWKI